jgi:hypothetical protein
MSLNRLMRYLPAAMLIGAPIHAAEPEEFFEKKIRPVLVEHCYSCHSASAAKLKGGLRVDGRDALLAGGDTGPAIVAGQPDKSKLIEALHFKNVDLQMPPKGKLPDAVIADLTTWVKMGAPWPGDKGAITAVKEAFRLEERKARHWAWQPVREQTPPRVKNEQWPSAPLDRFILAKLEERGIAPAKPAEPRALLRRLYFDLIGLPPTPEEIAEFEKHYRAGPDQAVAQVVDRLLASPQFGERWARHWLDLVRYGESRGHEFDPSIQNAWQYRDYVIRALNADVPYNQFVLEHIAGDLLSQPRLHPSERFNESIIGTGFWHLGEEVHSPVDIRADEADRFDNRLDVMTKTFLALTVTCARCHDHKFDAISTRDYYALYGFLRGSNYRQVRFDTLEHNKQVMQDLAELRRKHRPELLNALADALAPGVQRLPELLKQARAAMKSGARSDDELVRFWVTHLEKAARNKDDLFHLLAVAPERGIDLDQWQRERQARSAAEKAFEKGCDVIVDYGRLKPGEWLPDDAGYGREPVLQGEPQFSSEPRRPITRFSDRTAASLGPMWRGLRALPGTDRDYGALHSQSRAGKVLTTPGFSINSGLVHFLVKGNGTSYAGVDAHTLINGPLHGRLLMPFNTNGAWKWVTHDLKSYAGHRAHLEFAPSNDGDFEVALVVQGPLPLPAVAADDGFIDALGHGAVDLDELCRRYQELCTSVLADFRSNPKALRSDRVGAANWMLDNAGLLGVKTWDEVAKAAEPFMAAQAKLVAQLRQQSQLAPAMLDGTGVNEHVFIRGSYKDPGEVVPRRFLEALAGTKGIEAVGSGRLELARQMIDPNLNPFIARVFVNRVWHHLTGRGIVASTDNFGELGERPTHPEMLDYLSSRFVQDGWSMKKLVRQIVLSRAYQMSSQPSAAADAADPENLLLHRMRLRRLEGEAIRDAMLAVSGRLNPKMFGPSVPVNLTPFLEGRGRPASGPIDGDGRRSVYIAVRRNFLSPLMLAFDTPSPFSTVGRRTVSNVPAQALILMNDPFVHQMAQAWGKRMAGALGETDERIKLMYEQAFTRLPTDSELSNCRGFLEERARTGDAKAGPAAWAELAHVLFNVKEFIFVE